MDFSDYNVQVREHTVVCASKYLDSQSKPQQQFISIQVGMDFWNIVSFSMPAVSLKSKPVSVSVNHLSETLLIRLY